MKILTICLFAFLFVGCANKISGEGNTIHNENVQNPNLNIPLTGGFDAFGSSKIDTTNNLNISYFRSQK